MYFFILFFKNNNTNWFIIQKRSFQNKTKSLNSIFNNSPFSLISGCHHSWLFFLFFLILKSNCKKIKILMRADNEPFWANFKLREIKFKVDEDLIFVIHFNNLSLYLKKKINNDSNIGKKFLAFPLRIFFSFLKKWLKR